MAFTHERNVSGMQSAPRCEGLTSKRRACRNPALAGRSRCRMHDPEREQARYREKRRKRAQGISGRPATLPWEVHGYLRALEAIAREYTREGQVIDLDTRLRRVIDGLALLGETDRAHALPLTAPDRKAVLGRRWDRVVPWTTLMPRYGRDANRMVPDNKYDRDFPDQRYHAVANRARGALLGLAIGNAPGCMRSSTEAVATPAWNEGIASWTARSHGERTADTALSLALLEALKADRAFDEIDLCDRFTEVRETFEAAGLGCCFDPDTNLGRALDAHRLDATPLAAASASQISGMGCGSLARLAPVAVRYWNEHSSLREAALRQARATNAAPQTVHACVALAGMLGEAIAGVPRSELLRPRVEPLYNPIARVMAGSWADPENGYAPSVGMAAGVLTEAFRCIHRTATFRQALERAQETVDPSGLVLVVTGQLAGAHYGEKAIPQEWIDRIALRGPLVRLADDLAEHGMHSQRRRWDDDMR